MTTTTFGVRWKKTKEIYEATVKQKKPAEKILKVFRKSTEIESGLKAFDAAADLVGMRGTDRKAAAKAVAVLAKAETAAATSIKSYLVAAENDHRRQASRPGLHARAQIAESRPKSHNRRHGCRTR